DVNLLASLAVDVLLKVSCEQIVLTRIGMRDAPDGLPDAGGVLPGRSDDDIQIVRELDRFSEDPCLSADHHELRAYMQQCFELSVDGHRAGLGFRRSRRSRWISSERASHSSCPRYTR